MNRVKFIILILVVLLSPVVSAELQAQQITAESIHILRILDQEGKAMIKLPNGRMHILKVGEAIGKSGKVIEIVEGRIVIEERTDQGIETVIIRFEDGKQTVERTRKVGDKVPMPYSPSPKEQNQPGAPRK